MTELRKNDYGGTDNATSLFNSGGYDIEKKYEKIAWVYPRGDIKGTIKG